MKKIIQSLGFLMPLISVYAADIESAPQLTGESSTIITTPKPESAPVNNNAGYIAIASYIQNPYFGITSGGGTLVPQQKTMAAENFWEKWFANGTYNVYSGAATGFGGTGLHGKTGGISSYGTTIFGQTGDVNGFSIGGTFTAMNPWFSAQMNGSNQTGNPFSPGNQQLAVTQSFVEYKYSNIVNIDAGLIGINNSPWLSASYYNNMISVPVTYQGILANIYPGAGWLLTGLAFNASQTSGQQGFTGETMYGSYAGKNYMTNNAGSNGTVALGASYLSPDNNYNLRLWGYQFDNYGTLLYGDNSLKIPLNKAKTISLNFAGQAGVDNDFGGSNAYANNTSSVAPAPNYLNGSGSINSNFLGAQAGIAIDWFNLTLNANTIWGSGNAVGNGAIVSPYTTNIGTDPLYAEGWMTSMVNDGLTGNIYKLSTTFSFLNNNLSVSPNYVLLDSGNADWNGTQEAFVTLNYAVPQVKGLFFFGVFAYQWTPVSNPVEGKNDWTTSLLTSYLW